MFHALRILLISLATFASLAVPATAQDRIGVLMMHGKNPGDANDPYFGSLKSKFENDGMLVLMPNMPWSTRRYIDGDWDKAMTEIAAHVKKLRESGATKIVLAGHSMGCPAALSYAARHGDDVDALVLQAPGHVPFFYYNAPQLKIVRNSIDAARAMVAAGEGDKRRDFDDINQGKQLAVRLTAREFLSYWDPETDAEMSRTAPRLPARIPALVVVGDKDPLFSHLRSYLFEKFPANPKHQYIEVSATHLTTPQVSGQESLDWIKKAVAN